MQGCSVNDFVVAAVHEAAQRTIADAQIIQLSLEDQQGKFDNLPTPFLVDLRKGVQDAL
jgi:uncharacterized protein (DUF1778 family)